jgi:hypothetical protein
MHERTLAVLDELRNANWFSHVGELDTLSAIVVSSWHEAFVLGDSIEWENLRLDMANEYYKRLRERSKERWLNWNGVVDDLKKTLIPFVRGKIEHVVREQRLPKRFEGAVQWDIQHVCMETEYADVYPPGFYAKLASWYIKGHFPCGWQGAFPQGMLIIY